MVLGCMVMRAEGRPTRREELTGNQRQPFGKQWKWGMSQRGTRGGRWEVGGGRWDEPWTSLRDASCQTRRVACHGAPSLTVFVPATIRAGSAGCGVCVITNVRESPRVGCLR